MPTIKDCRTILVVGATAGLGRSLARAIHGLPSKPTIIVAGRRLDRLEELRRESGFEIEQLDVSTPRETLISSVNDILKRHPSIDAVIISAGIQRQCDFTKPETVNLAEVDAEWNVNFFSIVNTVSKCFIPHFQKLEKEGRPTFIIPISSGLALRAASFIPMYSATKAALHSYCASLQKQFEKSNIHIIEILPPLVESELHDHEGTTERLSKVWMPLDEWTKHTIDELLATDGSGFVTCGFARELFGQFEKDNVKQTM